jgi:hypothetical protein
MRQQFHWDYEAFCPLKIRYGTLVDAIDLAQLELAMKGQGIAEALSAPVTAPLAHARAKPRGKAKRRPLPDNLPTETIVTDPPEVLASPEAKSRSTTTK